MKRFAMWVPAGVLLAWVLTGCSGGKGDLLATVGDHSITVADFETGFASRPQSFTSFDYELEQRQKFLDELIDQKLLVVGAYQQGLDKNPEIERMIEQQQGKFLLDQLYRVEIAEKVNLDESEIRDAYERMGEEVHARHILLDSREAADSVRAELAAGADFAELARARSKDPSAAQNAGDLSWFRWGTMVPAFQEAVFALDTNEVSEPVQTEFGWHVIQLLERRPIDRQPYDQIKPALERQMKQIREQARLREFLTDVRNKAELRLDTRMLQIVQETYRDTTGPLEFASNLDPEKLNDKLRKEPIVRFLDTSLSTGDFIRLANQAPPVNRPSFYDTTKVKEFMFQMVYTTILEREALRLRIDHSEEYKQSLSKFRETLMADKMRSDLLQRPADVTTEMLHTYYDEHPEEFSTPPTVHVREALVTTEAEAGQIIERVRRGAKFDAICAEVTLRPGMKARRGDLGTFRRFEHPALFDAAQKIAVGQVGGPVYHTAQAEGQWSVIELIDRQDATTRTFEEVENRILTKLRNDMRQQTLEQWLAEMRASTNVSVNEDALANMIDKSKYPEKG